MSRTTSTSITIIVVLVLLSMVGMFAWNGTAGSTKLGVTTPLHAAASAGENGKVMDLLNAGADPKAVDENGKTPLHLSAEHGHPETTRVLLRGGADVNIPDIFGKRALDYAAANHHDETAAAVRPFTTDARYGSLGPAAPTVTR